MLISGDVPPNGCSGPNGSGMTQVKKGGFGRGCCWRKFLGITTQTRSLGTTVRGGHPRRYGDRCVGARSRYRCARRRFHSRISEWDGSRWSDGTASFRYPKRSRKPPARAALKMPAIVSASKLMTVASKIRDLCCVSLSPVRSRRNELSSDIGGRCQLCARKVT